MLRGCARCPITSGGRGGLLRRPRISGVVGDRPGFVVGHLVDRLAGTLREGPGLPVLWAATGVGIDRFSSTEMSRDP
jgi:hypothetical protein